MGGVTTRGGGDGAPAMKAQQGQDGMTDGGQRLCSATDMDLAAVFTQGLSPHLVQAVLDGPMAAPEVLQVGGAR